MLCHDAGLIDRSSGKRTCDAADGEFFCIPDFYYLKNYFAFLMRQLASIDVAAMLVEGCPPLSLTLVRFAARSRCCGIATYSGSMRRRIQRIGSSLIASTSHR